MYRPLSPLSGQANERLAGNKARRADPSCSGDQGHKRPINLLPSVNAPTQASLDASSISTCRIFLWKRRRFHAASFQNIAQHQETLFRKGCFYRGMLRIQHAPLPVSTGIPTPTQDRETGATAQVIKPVPSIHLRQFSSTPAVGDYSPTGA